jgi:hypothetical protein
LPGPEPRLPGRCKLLKPLLIHPDIGHPAPLFRRPLLAPAGSDGSPLTPSLLLCQRSVLPFAGAAALAAAASLLRRALVMLVAVLAAPPLEARRLPMNTSGRAIQTQAPLSSSETRRCTNSQLLPPQLHTAAVVHCSTTLGSWASSPSSGHHRRSSLYSKYSPAEA